MSPEEEFALALERGESWATAKAWLGAVISDEHLASYLTAEDLWDLAGCDVAGLRAVLPPPEVLEVLAPVFSEPLSVDREAVYLSHGDHVVSVFLRFREEWRDWQVEAVVTELVTKSEGHE